MMYYFFHYKFESNPTECKCQSKCLACLNSLIDLHFYGFYRGEGRRVGTLIEQGRDVDVLVLLNSDFRKQQSRGDMKNNIHEE